MNERDPDRTEAVGQIAVILAAAYVRLRFPEPPQKVVDCVENTRPHGTERLLNALAACRPSGDAARAQVQVPAFRSANLVRRFRPGAESMPID
jgi:hypothetical protein